MAVAVKNDTGIIAIELLCIPYLLFEIKILKAYIRVVFNKDINLFLVRFCVK